MDLRTFISETLTQIAGGVADAQQTFRNEGQSARINPTHAERGKGQTWGAPSPVEFDVALTVGTQADASSSEKAGGKAGFLSVVSLQVSAEVGGSQSSAQRQEQVSRIRFSVNLAQPADVEEYTMPSFDNDRNSSGGY